jgi:hypothetical protein
MATPVSSPGNPLTQAWAIGTLDRLIGTFVVAFVALIGLGAPGFDVMHVDWKAALAAAGSATALTLVKSLIAAFVGDTGTSSLLPGGK